MLEKISTLVLLVSVFRVAFAYEETVFNKSGQLGLKESLSAQTCGAARLSVFLHTDFSSDSKQVDTIFKKVDITSEIDTLFPRLTLFTFRPVIAFGVTDFFDVGIGLPLHFDIMDHFSPAGGLGDIEFSTKFRIPVKAENLVQSALFASLSLPTSSSGAGYVPRHAWNFKKGNGENSNVPYIAIGNYGSGDPESSLLALFSLCAKKIRIHINSGFRLTFSPDVDDLFILNGGVEFTPVPNVTLFGDVGSITTSRHVKDGFLLGKDHLRLGPGITLRSGSGAFLTFSTDVNLSSSQYRTFDDIGTQYVIRARPEPSITFSLQAGWSGSFKRNDKDGDQVPDEVDQCPQVPEDIDGFEDADGCPDFDNDQDGVPDSLDQCKNSPEDMDGFEDLDGCPDFDNDEDGIPDSIDQCRDIPEDTDGFEDTDGCPDIDNDKDGVPDSVDKCMMIPEDIDGFEDDDGCPDIDNDLDEIPDSLDQCPDQAGSVNYRGCESPEYTPQEIKFGKVILNGVDFGSGSATLSESSTKVLDQLAVSLLAAPNVTIEIQAHTDDSGDPMENIRLCQRRTDGIGEYLINKGVSRTRLILVGKGSAEPVGDNATVAGRKANTRIELHRKK